MKTAILSIFCGISLAMAAQETSQHAYFNFNLPETLNPAIATPALKDFVNLDGRTFTDGNVEITFEAADYGNTHVRLYKPYDIDGCDVRIYDGETLIVKSIDPQLLISEIQFTMSLSGAATGTNDINFLPSAGEFIWEEERWIPDFDTEGESTIYLTSFLQSRLSTMDVTLVNIDNTTGIESAESDDTPQSNIYYDLTGRKISNPTIPGIYIHNNKKIKI